MQKGLFWAAAFCALCFGLAAKGYAQSKIELSEVQVTAPAFYLQDKAYQDSVQKAQLGLADASAWLQQHTPAFVRQYGAPGQLATLNLRGTSAMHTAVLWEGVPLNSPTLGLSDLSLIPLDILGQTKLLPGGETALVGSDAVGGALLLENNVTEIGKGISFNLKQEIGSFGLSNTRLSTSLSSNKTQLELKVWQRQAENNFPYADKNQPETPTVRQQNAAFRQQGLYAALYHDLSAFSRLSSIFWVADNYREVQPVMSQPDVEDEQKDLQKRALFRYTFSKNEKSLLLQSAWTSSWQRFNTFSPNFTQTLASRAEFATRFSNFNFRFGGQHRYLWADLEQHGEVRHEHRSDVFAFLQWKKMRWNAILNLRQGFVTGYTAPFTPSLTLRFAQSEALNFYGKINRTYRAPTLNERYWQPGGNPDILPENAWGTELGNELNFGKPHWQSTTLFSVYYQRVNQWILWQPFGNFWAPVNLQEVEVRGVTVEERLQYQNWHIEGLLTFNQAINLKKSSRFDRTQGKQLIYTPRWKGHATLGYRTQKMQVNLFTQYVGERFTSSDNVYSLPNYWLWDVSFLRNFSLKKHQLSASLQLKNILNTSYEAQADRAMPGRHFLFSVSWNFNTTN